MNESNRSHRCERLRHSIGLHRGWMSIGCGLQRFAGTIVAGAIAMVWLVFRSGAKPPRISYPCQQAALGTAAAAFGAPLAVFVLAARGRIVRWATHPVPVAAFATVVLSGAVMWAIGSNSQRFNPVIADPPADYHPGVYLVNDARGIAPGRYGGVDDLVTLMGHRGLKWHRSETATITSGPDGLIDADDIVLIKVNAQWAQRGGTNTDVLRGVIRRVVEHPDGFAGEIIVADNGQGAGSLDRTENNAEDHGQSAQDVVNDFASEGWHISTFLWDTIRGISVSEYSAGDMRDGYVVNPILDPETLVRVSYAKFQSAWGTYVSYKQGIWSSVTQSYQPGKLVVINVPVFKTHSIYAVTAAVKNHMGVVTTLLSTSSHSGVGRGGLGSVLAEVRLPDLTILDCIWILARPGSGPSASYTAASRRDQLVASVDPVALDAWATKYIMIPQIIENGYPYEQYHNTQDPDNPDGVFRRYLDLSMNELFLAGIDATNDYNAVDLHVWAGDVDRDGDVDLLDFSAFDGCTTGPGGTARPECQRADLDADGDVDFADFARFQQSFTGAL